VGAPSPTGSSRASEQPLPADSAVPGDIPDTTQFVTYRSDAGHFNIRYPEGWAQQAGPSSVTFTGTLNTISVAWMPAATAPTVAGAQELAQLQQTERAFAPGKVSAVNLPAGPAVEITYQANSEPNAVTGKQYRLDVQRFELWKAGTEVVLTLSSPAGADNVDPWTVVSKSFTWL
jgi:hypothetical protein